MPPVQGAHRWYVIRCPRPRQRRQVYSDREWVCEPTTDGDGVVLRRNAQKAAFEVCSGRCRQPGPARCAGGPGRSVVTAFDIVVVKSGRVAVMQVRGELDLSTAPRLDEQLVSLAGEGVLGCDRRPGRPRLHRLIGPAGVGGRAQAVTRTGWRPGAALPEAEHAQGVEDHGTDERLSLGSDIEGAGFVDAIFGLGAYSPDWQMTTEHSHGAVD